MSVLLKKLLKVMLELGLLEFLKRIGFKWAMYFGMIAFGLIAAVVGVLVLLILIII